MTDTNRRTITKMFVLGTVCTVPLATVASLLPRKSLAATMVDPETAQAKALQYMEISETEGSSCSVCTLYQGDKADAGPCPLFSEQEVKSTGWCSAFTPKT